MSHRTVEAPSTTRHYKAEASLDIADKNEDELSVSTPRDYVAVDLEPYTEVEPQSVTVHTPNHDRKIDMVTLAKTVTDDGRNYIIGKANGKIGVLENRDGELHNLGSVEPYSGVTLDDADGLHVAKVHRRSQSAVSGEVFIEKTSTESQVGFQVEPTLPSTGRRGNAKEDDLRRQDEIMIEEHNRKWKRAKKMLAGIALAYVTFKSGGLVDDALEGFNEGHETVYEAVTPYEVGSKIDGNHYMDQRTVDQLNAPINKVARIMDDLDSHNYGAIRERADAFKKANPGELLTDEQKGQFHANIEGASSLDDLREKVKQIEHFYGFKFDLPQDDKKVSLEDTKRTVDSIFTGLERLPHSLVREIAHLKTVKVTNKGDGPADAEAYYSSFSDEIVVYAVGPVKEKIMDVLGYIPGVEGEVQIRDSFLHELGHALHEAGGVTNPDRTMLQHQKPGDDQDPAFYDPKYFAIDLARGIAMYPETISTYSRTDAAENTAENIAGVIDTNRSDGLAHPDEARRYQSPANKDMLKALVGLERAMPGIADYLISTDPRLMDKN